jgi:phosphatidate cytidylyltransferase
MQEKSFSSEMALRAISSAVLLMGLLLTIFCGYFPYFLVLLAGVMAYELHKNLYTHSPQDSEFVGSVLGLRGTPSTAQRLCSEPPARHSFGDWVYIPKGSQTEALFWGVCLAGTVLSVHLHAPFGIAALIYISSYVYFCIIKRQANKKRTVLYSLNCSFYILFSFNSLLRFYEKGGEKMIFWVFLCIWITDTSAFFFGKLLKGAKIAPKISPQKTWSGFMGGIFTTTIVCGLVGKGLHLPGTLSHHVLSAFCYALASHAGDLLESFLKRRLGVKDMGGIIPGHGGAWDRFDSLLMVGVFIGLFFLTPKIFH